MAPRTSQQQLQQMKQGLNGASYPQPAASGSLLGGKTPAPSKPTTSGQTSSNALNGDFFGGGSLPAPNVKAPNDYLRSFDWAGMPSDPFATKPPLQDPGNNFTNPGYSEQALNYTQNRLLEDPYADFMQNAANQSMQQSGGEQWLNKNLGSLNGPGTGDQYWNQVQGQFMDPFAGEQFARQATQQFGAQGASSAFNNQAQQQYGQFTNYSGPQNAQGQYGQSSGQLAGGTAGEGALGQIISGYGQNGTYGGPNYAAGQYGATQQSFGALPVANSADPFYDRATQLGTQDYNRQTASRGVYGSSEALSGVGNIITDMNAARAQNQFQNEMSIAQENRMRQELLGNQARNADLSGLGAFAANLQGASTYGNLANQQGQLELNRHEVLGQMANNADTQALGAQNANISGLNAFNDIANNADRNETSRYEARTNAMNQADKTALDRLSTGADIAFRGDENRRADFEAQANAANNSGQLRNDRLRTGAEIANTGSGNDLARLDSFNQTAQQAERDRQGRLETTANATANYSQQVQQRVNDMLDSVLNGDVEMTQQRWEMEIVPMLQAAGYEQKQIDQLWQIANTTIKGVTSSG